MAINFGEEVQPRVTLAEKIAPWLRRILIGGCLIWVCFSIQNFFVDTRSHTIKVVYPLLLSHEKITVLSPDFDPKKAVWRPVQTGFPVADGTVLFVKTSDAVYAVKIQRQTLRPEQLEYAWVKVGTTDSPVKATAGTLPDGIALPGHKIGWSGRKDGSGFLYLDDAFIWGQPPGYTIGVPFQSGDLINFRSTVPATVHFESTPWKIVEPPPDNIVPL